MKLHMLDAGRGDCLWIEYGGERTVRRILVDGGVPGTQAELRRRIEALPRDKRVFELLVITHIDLDHIGGVLELLRDPPEGLAFKDVWFNAYHHLPDDAGVLGAKQGEAVSYYLEKGGYAWNRAFGGDAVCIKDDELPRVSLAGGMKLTLLSPTVNRLRKLRPVWKKEIEKAGLEPGEAGATLEGDSHPEDRDDEGVLGRTLNIAKLASSLTKEDTSEANGSSIALLLEHRDKRLLLTGDAFAGDILAAIRLMGSRTLEVDALKLSHHGGKKNTSAALLDALACGNYLFSTDGSYYQHPHGESVARVLVNGRAAGKPTLWFNNRSEQTEVWDDRGLYTGRYPYTPEYPASGGGIVVEL